MNPATIASAISAIQRAAIPLDLMLTRLRSKAADDVAAEAPFLTRAHQSDDFIMRLEDLILEDPSKNIIDAEYIDPPQREEWAKWLSAPPGSAGNTSTSNQIRALIMPSDGGASLRRRLADAVAAETGYDVPPQDPILLDSFRKIDPSALDKAFSMDDPLKAGAFLAEQGRTNGALEDAARAMMKKHENIYSLSGVAGNMPQLAHELGHIDSSAKLNALSSKLWGDRQSNRDALIALEDMFSSPAHLALSPILPTGIKDAISRAQMNPIMEKIIGATIGQPLPSLASSAIATSQTVRDLLRKDPTGIGGKISDFAEEHPVVTGVSGFLPRLADETYATLKGGEFVKKYYERLQALPEAERAALEAGGIAKNIMGKSPMWEGIAAVGKNLPSLMTYILPAAFVGAAAYFGNNKDELTQKVGV